MQLAHLTWPAIQRLSPDTPLVFPVAAVEQHGHHLPIYTDSFLLGEVVQRTAPALEREVLFAPLLWLGNSAHHLDFAGTLSAEPRTYLDILGGLMENALRHGFRRIVFLNGHGGNDVPGRQAIFELRQRHRGRADLLLLFATYWHLGSFAALPGTGWLQQQMGHACEWETSMMLRVAPQWVGDFRQLAPVEFGNGFEPASRAWVTQDRTTPGYIGSPHAATAEKGERLLEHFSQHAVELLRRVVNWDGHSWNG